MSLTIMVTSVFSYAQTVDELGCCLRDNTSGYQIDFDPALFGGTWETFTIAQDGVEVFTTTDMTEPYSYIFTGAGEFVFTWTANGVTSVCPFFACLVEDPTDASSCCVAVGGSLETLQVKPPNGEATVVACETELDYCVPCQDCNEVPALVYTYEGGVICITDGAGSVTNDGGATKIPLINGCAAIEPFTETADGVETLKIDYYPEPLGATCEQCVLCIDVTDPDNDGDGTPASEDTDDNDPCVDTDYTECATNSVVAALDCDGGGVTDCEEITNGTDPTNPEDDTADPCADITCEGTTTCVEGVCECIYTEAELSDPNNYSCEGEGENSTPTFNPPSGAAAIPLTLTVSATGVRTAVIGTRAVKDGGGKRVGANAQRLAECGANQINVQCGDPDGTFIDVCVDDPCATTVKLTFTNPDGAPVDFNTLDWENWTVDATYFEGSATQLFTDINDFLAFVNANDPNGGTWTIVAGEILCTTCPADVVIPTAEVPQELTCCPDNPELVKPCGGGSLGVGATFSEETSQLCYNARIGYFLGETPISATYTLYDISMNVLDTYITTNFTTDGIPDIVNNIIHEGEIRCIEVMQDTPYVVEYKVTSSTGEILRYRYVVLPSVGNDELPYVAPVNAVVAAVFNGGKCSDDIISAQTNTMTIPTTMTPNEIILNGNVSNGSVPLNSYMFFESNSIATVTFNNTNYEIDLFDDSYIRFCCSE